jgi:hypothetical protein
MNHSITPLGRMNIRMGSVLASCLLAVSSANSADTAATAMSAADLAARLAASQQDGSSYVRLKMDVKQAAGTEKVALQFQIKQRRTKAATEIVYQVLWPKERKGEAFLLRKTGDRPATGAFFRPPDNIRTLEGEQMKDPVFGSDLTYEDLIENFFTWEHQAIVGTALVDRVNCQILESKPGRGQRSSYASVRTWVDTRRLVPLRVEKYSSSGSIVRRMDSLKISTDDIHRSLPSNLSVHGRRQDGFTELDGSRIRHDITYTDRDFTPENLKELSPVKSTP